jgi:hypothetical protein
LKSPTYKVYINEKVMMRAIHTSTVK